MANKTKDSCKTLKENSINSNNCNGKSKGPSVWSISGYREKNYKKFKTKKTNNK